MHASPHLDFCMGVGDLLGSPCLYSKLFTNFLQALEMNTQDTGQARLTGACCWEQWSLPCPSLHSESFYLATFPLPRSPMRYWERTLRSHLHLHIHTHNWFLISLCWRGIKSYAGKNCCRMEPCSGWRERKGSSKKPLSLRFRQTRVVLKQLRPPVGCEFPVCVCRQNRGWRQRSAQLGDFTGA